MYVRTHFRPWNSYWSTGIENQTLKVYFNLVEVVIALLVLNCTGVKKCVSKQKELKIY